MSAALRVPIGTRQIPAHRARSMLPKALRGTAAAPGSPRRTREPGRHPDDLSSAHTRTNSPPIEGGALHRAYAVLRALRCGVCRFRASVEALRELPKARICPCGAPSLAVSVAERPPRPASVLAGSTSGSAPVPATAIAGAFVCVRRPQPAVMAAQPDEYAEQRGTSSSAQLRPTWRRGRGVSTPSTAPAARSSDRRGVAAAQFQPGGPGPPTRRMPGESTWSSRRDAQVTSASRPWCNAQFSGADPIALQSGDGIRSSQSTRCLPCVSVVVASSQQPAGRAPLLRHRRRGPGTDRRSSGYVNIAPHSGPCSPFQVPAGLVRYRIASRCDHPGRLPPANSPPLDRGVTLTTADQPAAADPTAPLLY